MSANIFPGMITTPRVSPLYVGGIPIEALNEAIQQSQNTLGAQKNHTGTRFWSSLPRASSDSTREIFEIGLSSAQLVNYASFDMAHFPHRTWLQAFDGHIQDWVPVLDTHGRPLVLNVTDSLPSQITPLVVNQGAAHPQHYGAGHWLSQEIETTPITSSRFRVIMVRLPTGQPPVDSFGNDLAYSLGMRDFALGYRVRTREDVPRTARHATVAREYVTFANSTDPLGSAIEFSLRENRASDLLQGRAWKCEPQPIADAVVNLFVDARDAMGNPQVVDRFYIEPTTVGPQLNLYYSNTDPPFTRSPAIDDALSYPNIIATGPSLVSDDNGILFFGGLSCIDISNSGMHLDLNQPWWMGLVIQPQFNSTDPLTHTLFDTGNIRLDITAGLFSLTIGSVSISVSQSFSTNETLSLVVGADGLDHFLVVSEGSNVASALAAQEVETALAVLRVGSRLGPLTSGSFRLQKLVIKQEPIPVVLDLGNSFASNSDNYILRSTYGRNDLGGSDNALLRYHPTFRTNGVSSVSPFGFVGGPPNRYASVSWIPIHRDYRLRRGYLQFDAVKARYFKFEMTSLVAETYDTLGPVVRKVKVFPPLIRQSTNSPLTTSSNNNSLVDVHTGVAAVTQHYIDEQRLPYLDRSNIDQFSPVEGVYSADPTIAERLRQKSLYYHVIPWQHDWQNLPRFQDQGLHNYSIIDVEHTNRVAFFAGLSKIVMYRLDYTSAYDTDQYLELFHDSQNLASNSWILANNQITTSTTGGGSATFSQAVSKIFSSTRKLRGIQFATQQTPAFQVLSDPDFFDPSLTLWQAYGDALPLTSNIDFISDVGSTVLIQRSTSGNFWLDIQNRYANWLALEQSDPRPLHPAWSDLEISPTQLNYGGIVGLEPIQPSSAGRIYAATRVYSEKTLSAPLLLQIVSTSGIVLAEKDVTPQGGQITEWYVGYTIGEGGTTSSLNWSAMEALGTYAALEALGTWDSVAQVTGTLTTQVVPRLVQQGATSDSWLVDDISIFDDPIVWEFSDDGGTTFYPVYDIKNDPNGVFLFPDADVPTLSVARGTQLVYRVTGYRDAATVASLSIRPWYTDEPMGRVTSQTLQFAGPNQAAVDQYSPISEDARFKTWNRPIPEAWNFRFRRWLLLPIATGDVLPVPLSLTSTILPESIPAINEGAPATLGIFLPDTFYGG